MKIWDSVYTYNKFCHKLEQTEIRIYHNEDKMGFMIKKVKEKKTSNKFKTMACYCGEIEDLVRLSNKHH